MRGAICIALAVLAGVWIGRREATQDCERKLASIEAHVDRVVLHHQIPIWPKGTPCTGGERDSEPCQSP